jgi:large subunit ribosomal protein L15
MNLHSLTNTVGARKTKKRLGRGMASGLGKTSGRGHKGQYARSGHKHKLGFEGGQMRLIRRIPKRGFTNISRKDFVPVNVGQLDAFASGTEVTPDVLKAKGLAKGVSDGIKILAVGTLTKKLTVKANAFSAGAKAKIEAAGGTCEVINKA